MKSKIIYITPVLVPNSSAASKRIISNSLLINSLGFDVSIFSGHDQGEAYDYEGIEIIPAGFKISSSKGLMKFKAYHYTVKNIIQKIAQINPTEIKALIIYSGYSFYLYPLLNWAKTTGVPVVFDAVEWYTPAKTLHWLVKPYYWNTEWAMRKLIPKTRNVICISRYLESYYTSKKCHTVILPPLVSSVKSYENSQNTRRVSYSGSPGRKDQLNIIFEALEEVNKESTILFDIVGLSEAEVLQYDFFRNKRSTKLPPYINAHGFIKTENAQQITAMSDFSVLFRLPTKTNTAGFPTKVVESLSLGVPILLNLSSDLGEYLVDGDNAIVIDSIEIELLKLAFKRIINMSNEQLSYMKIASINTTKKSFHIDSRKNEIQKFLNNLKC